MLDRQKLINAGIDYDEGMERFCDNEAIYEKYLKKFLNTNEFHNISEQITEKKYVEAFKTAHALKGMLGNLSMTKCYNAVSKLTEILRDSSNIQERLCMQYLREAEEWYLKAKAIV